MFLAVLYIFGDISSAPLFDGNLVLHILQPDGSGLFMMVKGLRDSMRVVKVLYDRCYDADN